MFIGKRVVSICVFLFLGLTVSLAQGQQAGKKVTEAEVEQFAGALQAIQMISQNMQPEMVKAVEDAELTIEKFTAMQQAQQNPEQEMEASEEDQEKFALAMQAMQKIQMDAQMKMQKAIEESGMTVERYQQIAGQAQQDTELQQRIQQYMKQ